MEPTYFGDSEKPLFGIYHPPLINNSKENAVLICYPIFQEYIRSHRLFRIMSEQLAKSGTHVFRFDYSCTGDSYGETTRANLSQWLKDIELAITELRDLSGLENISVLGLRMGALLASNSNLKDIENFIMWDPVTNGSDYMQSLSGMHESMLIDTDRFIKPRNNKSTNEKKELLGFSMGKELFHSIESGKTFNEFDFSKKTHLIITSNSIENINNTESHFSENKTIKHHTISDDNEWNNLDKIEDAIMPVDIIDRIIRILS